MQKGDGMIKDMMNFLCKAILGRELKSIILQKEEEDKLCEYFAERERLAIEREKR